MAVEAKRGCGYRKVGGIYLMGGLLSAPCDRLPLPLPVCETCGQGIKLTRSFTSFNAYKLLKIHKDCKDEVLPCLVCTPPDREAFLMPVGNRHYTPQSFVEEAKTVGVCKRVPYIPKGMKIDETVVYLAHAKVMPTEEKDDKGNQIFEPGIFTAFIPQGVERLVWQSELKGKKGEELKKTLKKRGITPVAIPDGDKDHA